MSLLPLSKKILQDTWFLGKYLTPSERDSGALMKMWYSSDPEFDQKLKTDFEESILNHQSFAEEMKKNPHDLLAYIILMDQFPRNIYRNTAKAFQYDPIALDLSLYAIEKKFDKEIDGQARLFMYLPLEHSESMDMQNLCLSKVTEMDAEQPDKPSMAGYAKEHHELIARFGRFPHRNAMLGRENTPEEAAFLEEKGGAMFGQGGK